MPIKHNEKDVIIDFEYTTALDETGKGTDDPLYRVRYHFTEIGPTVSLSPCNSELISFDDNGHSYVSFPANMLVEISDFLASKGFVQRSIVKKVVSPGSSVYFESTGISKSATILPPVVTSSASILDNKISGTELLGQEQVDVINVSKDANNLEEPISVSTSRPFQSFSEDTTVFF